MGGLTLGVGDGDNRLPLAVVDEDGSALSSQLFSFLEMSDAVRPERMALTSAEQALADDSIPAFVIIPAGFDATLRSGQTAALRWRQESDNLNALAAEQALRAAMAQVSRALIAARASVAAAEAVRPFANEAARAGALQASLDLAQRLLEDQPERLDVGTAALEPSEGGDLQYDQGAQAAAGQLITWVFIPLLGASGLFAFERTQGTLRRLLTTPTGNVTFLSGSIAGQFVIAVVQMLILIAFGIFVMGLDWGRAPGALLASLMAFALAAVAMGTTLGTFVKTESQANGISIMLGMVMALLGGCWYPLELFPPGVQTVVHVLPTTWAMQALTDLTMRGQGFAAILPEVGVLLGYALVFFVIGVRRFRFE